LKALNKPKLRTFLLLSGHQLFMFSVVSLSFLDEIQLIQR